MAKVQITCELTFPGFNDDASPVIRVENLRHPAIRNCIANSLTLGETRNLIYLTGANMSGKSSFLKAFGCAVFLAHIGMGVPAARMTLTPLDGLISNVNNEDNVSAGESYFLSEVRRVKSIAGNVIEKKKMLVICDELFRGTNVIDARDCTHVVVEGFAACKNSLFLIASHIHDLKKEIMENKSIGLFCFESTIENCIPVFPYTLKQGLSDQRYGLHILTSEGVVELLGRARTESRTGA